MLYGVKIKGKWFSYGPILYATPYDHTVPPFTKLDEIAMDNIFKGYLKQNKNDPSHGGEWGINDALFARFYERYAYNSPFTTQETREESWLKLMRENWTKRDTTNYKPLQ